MNAKQVIAKLEENIESGLLEDSQAANVLRVFARNT